MWIRSMMLMFAVGCVATGDAVEDQTATTAQNSSHGSGYGCENNSVISGVTCVGSIAILPITVNIKDIRVLNDNELNILSGDLNNFEISNILNYNEVLNYLELNVLDVFHNSLNIPVVGNEVNVCTTVLGGLLCSGY